MYQRKYTDKPESEWKIVSKQEAVNKLGDYYYAPEAMLDELRNYPDQMITTPWTLWRWIDTDKAQA